MEISNRFTSLVDSENDDLDFARDNRDEQRKAKAQRKDMFSTLGCLSEKDPVINSVGAREIIEFMADSGATESADKSSALQSAKTTVGDKCKNGVEYESACGQLIPDEGEKNCVVSTNDAPREREREKSATF